MRPDLITQVVPHADPEFLRTLEKLPDPPSSVFERVMSALPSLHEIFLVKRAAAARGDTTIFAKAVDQEVALLQGIS